MPFTIAIEEGLRRQQQCGQMTKGTKIKEEPVVPVSQQKRCGQKTFTLRNLKVGKGPDTKWNSCATWNEYVNETRKAKIRIFTVLEILAIRQDLALGQDLAEEFDWSTKRNTIIRMMII